MTTVTSAATIETKSLSQQMSAMCNTFLDKIRLAQGTNLDGNGTLSEIDDELETRFKAVSKIDHDNVIKKLVSQGFKRQPVVSSLNILLKDGYRIPITGEQNVYNFCNSNHMTDAMYEKAEKKVRGQVLDFFKEDEYPFRVTASTEQKVTQGERESIKASFNVMEKTYRYIRRVTFVHENYPYLVIDMSTVKQSTKYQQSFLSSGIFNILDTYEIEIEFKKDPDSYFRGTAAFKQGLRLTDANIKKTVIPQFQKYIKYVLGGIQESNYPISIKVQNAVHADYNKLLSNQKEGSDKKDEDKASSRRSLFLGPSSKTLQIDNIVPMKTGDDLKVPNIRVPGAFCVTEKADGERHLMFVNVVGKIYLITSNMQIKFTGGTCDPKVCKNTIIDGELILHNKKREFINTFAAFDLYFLNGEDVRFLKFMPIPRVLEKHLEKKTKELGQEYEEKDDKEKDEKGENKNGGNRKTKEEQDKWATKYRLTLLNEIMNAIRLQLASTENSASATSSAMTFKTKDFYPAPQNATLTKEDDILAVYNIFRATKAVLDTEFPYDTDGAIFTHTSFGVGGHDVGQTGPIHKATWEYSLKWKPSRLNTNDFLIITEKDKTKGGDKITSKFQDGTNMLNLVQSLEYKHLQLFCGNRSQNEIFEHPCEDVYNGVFPKRSLDPTFKRNVYQAAPFVPVHPYDANAAFSSVLLNKNGLMITEEGQPFESDTIVEFRYDTTHHKWIPLRVRYDKTAEYKAGKSQYGNSFETANSNWTSIHFPVTEHMITTGRMDDGEEIRETEYNPDAYYKNDSEVQTQTRGLRDFHNQYVKQWLIKSVCRPGNTLIDLACGKAGDLQKWIHARLSFVYGVDYSQDNLTNLLNGACARYLNSYKKFRNMPGALFVHGDSSKNIVSGAAMFSQQGKEINEVVFGERRSSSTNTPLGKGVIMQANRGKDGFNVTSCQFAMHYMFKSPTTFYNFIENIAECTKNNGYYIATCYDGAAIFNLLKGTPKDSIVKESKLVWEIVKKYDAERELFPSNDTSLGMEISVYQESINAWISEYLVNFELFDKTMNEYGMYLLTDAELNEINFPLKKSSGLFEDLFSHMIGSPNSDKMYGTAAKMQDYEKKISFLNRYFIYRSRNHTKRDYARITASHLSKHGLTEGAVVLSDVPLGDAVIGDATLGEAYTEHKMGDISDSDGEECHYDSRLHHVLSKITREKSKKSPNIQNILHLIESDSGNAISPSVNLLKNIDEQLKKYKVTKDPNAGKEFICDRLIKYLTATRAKAKDKNKEREAPPTLNKDTRVIDIGGGNGNLLHCFGEKFNIPKDHLVSIENGSFEYTYTHGDTVTYKTLAPKDDNNILNISDQVFKDADYILCMVTLHHMTDENIRNTIQFIKSHIKRGGYVLIKEHDADNQDTKCLINWEHHLYRLMEHVDGPMPDKDIQDYVDNVYIGNYKEEAYFDRLFASADFKLVATLDHVLDPTKTGAKKWERNPTQMYWKVFQYAA
jgi:hypothetical protein